MKRLLVMAALLTSFLHGVAAEETCRVGHVVVSYTGISKEYAESIARTAAAARDIAVEQFAFDMPETITISCEVGPGVRLFNDGQDRMSLTVRSEKDLRRPSAGGMFVIYGICHEIGHLAMYRLIRDHTWMSTEGAEGWAHYLGSRLVDGVHAREGADLWPDAYDYLADGTKPLQKQIDSSDPSPTARGAAC